MLSRSFTKRLTTPSFPSAVNSPKSAVAQVSWDSAFEVCRCGATLRGLGFSAALSAKVSLVSLFWATAPEAEFAWAELASALADCLDADGCVLISPLPGADDFD